MKSSTVAVQSQSLATVCSNGSLTIFVSNKHFTIEHLVVSEDIVKHLLIQVLRRRLEGDLHTTGLLRFEVDIPARVSGTKRGCCRASYLTGDLD